MKKSRKFLNHLTKTDRCDINRPKAIIHMYLQAQTVEDEEDFMANQTVAKTAAVKTEEKKAAVKAEETKAAVKTEEKKAAPAAVKEEKPVKKEAPKKEAAKKEPVKKTAAKKAAAPKKEAEATVYVQYQDAEIEPKKVLEQVKTDWVNAGHRASSIKKVDLHIKPEESKAYWVINEKETGSVDL